MESTTASYNWGTIWSAVSAIATVIAALGIFLAGRQLKFQAFLRAQEIWTASEFIALRGWALAQPDGWTKGMSAADFEMGKDACRRLDEFAHLVPYLGWFPPTGRRNVFNVWAEPLAKLWYALKPVVAREREITQWDKKWDAFARLGEGASDFLKMRSNFPW